MRASILSGGTLSAVVFLALATTALAGGPPRLLVEAPPAANPAASDKALVDAVLVLRAEQCGEALTAPITARAEGLVNGERKSLPITLRSSAKPGIYSVKKTWPSEGRWILTFFVNNHGLATTIVELAPDGSLPKDAAKAVRSVEGRVAASEIDAQLRGPGRV